MKAGMLIIYSCCATECVAKLFEAWIRKRFLVLAHAIEDLLARAISHHLPSALILSASALGDPQFHGQRGKFVPKLPNFRVTLFIG